jgi:SAM-dependent methyltransferase
VPISNDHCRVCQGATRDLPALVSKYSGQTFAFRRCDACGLSFVPEPRTDFASLYDAEYYAGRGADTFVNYLAEMSDARTVREYEWRGIFRAVTSLTRTDDISWLDFGCGLGGLVRYARSQGVADVYGFDEGWSAQWMADNDIPSLDADDLAASAGRFDVITAIEVIEHLTDPVAMMRQIATLLKPGGVFFLTTGNAEPHRDDMGDWKYVHPDVHISYFEPRTLATVYGLAGLEPVDAGFLPGHADIIRYKVLMTLGVKKRNVVERLIPWSLVARVVDFRHKVSAQPVARRPGPGDYDPA